MITLCRASDSDPSLRVVVHWHTGVLKKTPRSHTVTNLSHQEVSMPA